MDGFVASAAGNTAGSLATEYASPYVGYFFHFGKIIEDFKHQRNLLSLKKDQVKKDVDEAIRQTEVIEKNVQDWLTDAEKELGEAQNLEDEVERSKCFKWCPNLGWRYCLGKKVTEKTRRISELRESSNFPRVGHRPSLEGIDLLIPNDHFMPSETSAAAFKGIMKALTRDDVCMIGLYGMPGVGKTTLAVEVGKHAGEKLFDKVVFVTVSQTPDFNKIQDEIAEKFKFRFEATSEKGRAEELWRRLKGENKVLIIFDDIWKCYSDDDDIWDRLKMKYIGIPFGDEHQGCKILLTTRSEEVCGQMKCQEKIQLDLLSEDEAWTLFKDNASLENPSPHLIDVAKEVARECQGLPLAIITIGRALKEKTLDEWEAVNQRLKDCRHRDNQDVSEVIYKRIKISYDYLKVKNCRSCLLLCSLFPEDYKIHIEELTAYGIGQGMFDEVNSVKDARKEMRAITTKLQESGLLLETAVVDTVNMHDVVRDFAHWMTSKGENDQNMFYVRSGLKKWPKDLGCYTAISLINSEINNFPDRLEFSKLEIFLLDEKQVANSTPPKISSMFFQGMKALKVLYLKGLMLSLDDLQFLPNLGTLHLQSCELKNASWLGNLKKLEILIITDCRIEELWYESMGLTTLRSLSIYCKDPFKVFVLPKDWLSRCSLVGLEELNLGLNVEWAISTEESANKVSLSELDSLSYLTQLSLKAGSECIPKQFVFPSLQSYDIVVDETSSRGSFYVYSYKSGRWLRIWRCTTFSLNAFKKLYSTVEDLDLGHIMDLEYLIDTTKKQGSNSGVPNLVRLALNSMICLKELCHGLPSVGFLPKLETLAIKRCPKLVLEDATVHNLKELSVEECEQFQVIFQTDGVLLHANPEIHQMPLESSLTQLCLGSLPELRSIWKGPTHHVSLRNLKVVKISSCNKLTSVFSLSLAQTLLHLERLEILYCNGLEQVFDNLAEETEHGQDIQLPQLQSLVLKDLQNLSSICPRNYFVISASLNNFQVLNCPKLTQSEDFLCAYKDIILCSKKLTLDGTSRCRNLIPDIDGEGLNGLVFLKLHNCSNIECLYEATEHRQPTIAFSNLVELVIREMIGLKKLCNNRPPKGFLQKLEKLEITNCMNLASLSPVGQNLKEVRIKSCGQLREIFQVDEVLQNLETNQAPILMSNLTALDLHQLSELRRIWKGPSHSVINLQSLEFVTISNCNRLRWLFSPSLVKSLVQLERLILHDLPELEQLITELESDAEQEQQVINKVEEKVDEPCLPLMLPSLKYFEVSRCPRLTPFVIQQEVNNLAQVKGLYLSNQQCSSFDILLRQSLPNLEHGIVGSHLQSLQRLIMSNCSKLKYLFSPMLAQSLPHLSFLHIMQCKDLEQIIDEDKTSASSSQGHLQPICFSSLTQIHIEECNKLKCLFLASVALSLPKLQKFTIRGASKLEQVFEYQGGMGIEDIKKDKTSASSSQGHLQPICFSSLYEIHIEECNNLKCLFPVNVAFSLPKLQKVIIKGASELEQVFEYQGGMGIEDIEKDKTSASSSQGHLQPICFSSLNEINIEECNKLKCLFPVSVAPSLSQLRLLKIRETSELEQVFEYQGGKDIEDIEKEIVLPRLGCLSLEVLPRLKSFIPMAYHCSFPNLYSLNVKQCPNLTTSFRTDSTNTMHAKTKVAGDLPMEASTTDVDVTEVSDANGETATPVGSDINWDHFDGWR